MRQAPADRVDVGEDQVDACKWGRGQAKAVEQGHRVLGEMEGRL